MTMEIREDIVLDTLESKKNKRGFTLTEIAIVLGIIGLILGAIWVAAAAVYTNMRISKSQQHLLAITQAIRSLYSTSVVTGEAADTDITAKLIPAGVFPSDLLASGSASTAVSSAWAGANISVYSVKETADGDAFAVGFIGIPSAGCINILISASGSGRDPGLLKVAGKNAALADLKDGTVAAAYQSPPMTVTQASSACGTGTASAVFKFRLRV